MSKYQGSHTKGKCNEFFHAEVKPPLYCGLPEDHEEETHRGFGVQWLDESHADTAVAQRFVMALRRIPNGNHEIYLNDDATVSMTMRGFESAVRFLGIRGGSDD